MSIVGIIIFLLMFTALINAINENHIPMIFMNGLFSFLTFFLIFKKSSKITKSEKTNQKKFIYSFDLNTINFIDLKNDLLLFYKPLGFTSVVIDKEASWMLESDKHKQAYIFISLKDNLINLEVYNAPEYKLHPQLQ